MFGGPIIWHSLTRWGPDMGYCRTQNAMPIADGLRNVQDIKNPIEYLASPAHCAGHLLFAWVPRPIKAPPIG